MAAEGVGLAAGRSWTSDEVAAALGVPSPAKLKFKGIATDSRYPIADSLFVALKGENFDAHTFLEKARSREQRRPSYATARLPSPAWRSSR
jgi:hypothetical protein